MPVAHFFLNVLVLAVIILLWWKLSPYLESFCKEHGMDQFYHLCRSALPVLIILGLIYAAVGCVLQMVLQTVQEAHR